jgi:hypothetical protein
MQCGFGYGGFFGCTIAPIERMFAGGLSFATPAVEEDEDLERRDAAVAVPGAAEARRTIEVEGEEAETEAEAEDGRTSPAVTAEAV